MKYKVLLATVLLLGVYTPLASALTIFIESGTPKRDGGNLTFKVNGFQDVVVTVPAESSDEDKAKKIETAFKATFTENQFEIQRQGNTVAVGNKNLKLTTIEKTKDTTEEVTLLKVTASVPSGKVSIDYHDVMSTIVAPSLTVEPSIFQAAFGFNNIIADASLSFESTPTVATLLTSVFAELSSDLPDIFKDSLSLDLQAEVINFTLPSNSLNVFVSNFSSDVNIFSTLGISTESVPEPSANVSLLALGLVGVGGLLSKRKARQQVTGP